MGTIKELNIKNQTYYFYNDIIDIETFVSKMLKLDKKRTKILIFTILDMLQLKKIGYGYDINSVNPLYLRINNRDGYIEKKDSNKYLVFDSTDKNKELLKKYNDVFNEIMSKIKKVDDDWLEYSKDYMKIRFS